jgi:uncharacterized DUF497 family protein
LQNFRAIASFITVIQPALTVVHICTYNRRVEYEWDPVKANANFRKHGVLFSDAVSVFEDELALTVRDPYPEEEERWVTVGMDLLGRLLVVVYVWRGETIRIISARHATPRERQEYQGAGPSRHPPDEEKP